MTVYLITYDLKKGGQFYSELYEELESFERSHDLPCVQSTWLIESSDSINQVYKRLNRQIDENDCLLVTAVETDPAGRLQEETWEWIDEARPL